MIISPSAISPYKIPTFQSGGEVPFSFGNALQFDGVNDFVDITEISLSGQFTISMWINSARFTNNQAPLFGHNTVNINYFEFRGNSSVRLRNSTGIIDFAMPALSTGVWYNYIFTRDSGNNVKTFINNIESSTGSKSNSGAFNIENIGAHISFGLGWFSQGTYDEIAIWDGITATAQNRTDLYNGGNGALASDVIPSPLAYWRCNEADGALTLVDETGTYNGTLNNFSTPPAYFIPH
jgi:hypothetical protein